MYRPGILALSTLLALSLANVAIAGDCSCGQPASSCGCRGAHYCKPCHHRHRRCCDCESESSAKEITSRTRRIAEIPAGPIVDSMAVMRVSPAVMTMQIPVMMGGMQGMSVAQQPRPETTCESSHKDVLELEAKIQALDLRMQTIQRAVELQNRFLEELRDGKIKQPKE